MRADSAVEKLFVEAKCQRWTADPEHDSAAIRLGSVLTELCVLVSSSYHIWFVPDLELQWQVVAATVLENKIRDIV